VFENVKMKTSKHTVGIVGAGNVGVAGAYAMLVGRMCSELVLVDLDKKRAQGEALDLMHGQGFVGRRQVQAGEYADLARCQVVVVAAGAGQKPGETRLELLDRNAHIFASIAHQLDQWCPHANVVVASNPVDILTYMMQQFSRRPKEKVIGTGTMLDTSRFRTLLGAYYDVDPQSVHGYVLGEHGDSEFAAWSTVTIGGRPIVGNTLLGRSYDGEAMQGLFQSVRNAAYEIIDAKGYTNWAIGLALGRLAEILLEDSKSIQPVSVRLEGQYGVDNVCISVPARLGMHGVEAVIALDLTDEEQSAFEKSAQILKESLASIPSSR
jgi:L-lactate dehydrogenase